jgi:hypothetical protein
MTRKLATVRRINDIQPIEDADSIDVATVGGWQVVIKKNERIRLLAEQAGFDLGNGQTYKVENFAELIVRECAMLVEGFEITIVLHGHIEF